MARRIESDRRASKPRESRELRFEVGLWAALARHGVQPRYEVGAAGSKAAELLFADGTLLVSLEAKTLPPSEPATNRALVRQIVHDMVEELDMHGVSLRVELDGALAGRCRTNSPTTFARAMESVQAESLAWAEATRDRLEPGEHVVAGLGRVVVGPDEPEQVTWEVPALDPDDGEYRREFIRALRLVRQGSSQVAAHHGADARVVAVNTSRWRAPVGLAREHIEVLISRAEDRSAYEQLDAIVLLNSHRFREDAPVDVLVLMFPWTRPGFVAMPWLRALGNVRIIA